MAEETNLRRISITHISCGLQKVSKPKKLPSSGIFYLESYPTHKLRWKGPGNTFVYPLSSGVTFIDCAVPVAWQKRARCGLWIFHAAFTGCLSSSCDQKPRRYLRPENHYEQAVSGHIFGQVIKELGFVMASLMNNS